MGKVASTAAPLSLSEHIAAPGECGLVQQDLGQDGDGHDTEASHALAARSPSVFPDELYQAPRSWAERAYPHNLIHYNKLDRGGHFAAWEQPDLFAAEMRAAFRSLR